MTAARRQRPPGYVRIIGGEWRGRRLTVPRVPGLRPTPDRVRETVFNWLQADIVGARCLDLFAGAGALGFEAASRQASKVVMVDTERQVVEGLAAECERLGATTVEVIAADAREFLTRRPRQFDIVFVDPPFRHDMVGPICERLDSAGWLATDASVYIELERDKDALKLPAGWVVLREQQAGQVRYLLAQRKSIH